MNKILGRFTLLLLLSNLFSMASYRWTVDIDKNSYYENENFLVTFSCQFDDRAPDIYIAFEPKLDGFVFEKFSVESRVISSKRQEHYRYLVKSTKAGKHPFSVMALMRETTDDSIKETVLGRDNDQEIVYNDTKVETPKVLLNIIKNPVALVGDFKIDVSYSKDKLNFYEPLQLKIRVSGSGDFKALKPFEFVIPDTKVFRQSRKHYKMTEKGYEGSVVWQYALSSANPILFKEQKIAYFDPDEKHLKYLVFKAKKINVAGKKDVDILLDHREFPSQSVAFDWTALLEKLFYFLLGALAVVIFRYSKLTARKKRPKSMRFETVSELLGFLTSKPNYKELLQEIEDDIKNKKVRSVNYYVASLNPEDQKKIS